MFNVHQFDRMVEEQKHLEESKERAARLRRGMDVKRERLSE
jgi:hypothetical protein